MQLNKTHRESLLTALIEAKDELELGRSLNRENHTENFKDWQDITLFLLEERVKLIEKSLINNEIDF